MTKKKLSQNEDDKEENPAESITDHNSTQNSETSDISKKKFINKTRYKYVFYTPIKKVRSRPYIPKTPKKKKKAQEYVILPIIGKNHLNIFDSM